MRGALSFNASVQTRPGQPVVLTEYGTHGEEGHLPWQLNILRPEKRIWSLMHLFKAELASVFLVKLHAGLAPKHTEVLAHKGTATLLLHYDSTPRKKWKNFRLQVSNIMLLPLTLNILLYCGMFLHIKDTEMPIHKEHLLSNSGCSDYNASKAALSESGTLIKAHLHH